MGREEEARLQGGYFLPRGKRKDRQALSSVGACRHQRPAVFAARFDHQRLCVLTVSVQGCANGPRETPAEPSQVIKMQTFKRVVGHSDTLVDENFYSTTRYLGPFYGEDMRFKCRVAL
jgi:hypothetical protein